MPASENEAHIQPPVGQAARESSAAYYSKGNRHRPPAKVPEGRPLRIRGTAAPKCTNL